MILTMKRRHLTLVLTSDVFEDDLLGIPEEHEVVVTIRRARSPQHLRFFFAKLAALIKGGIWEADKDSLLDYIKIGIGHCLTIIDKAKPRVRPGLITLACLVRDRHGLRSEEAVVAMALIDMAGPTVHLVPKSIDFASMSQDKFNDFDRRADAFIAERFGVDASEM